MSAYVVILIFVILIALLIITAGKFDNLFDMRIVPMVTAPVMPTIATSMEKSNTQDENTIHGGRPINVDGREGREGGKKHTGILKTKDLTKHPRTKSEARAVEILSAIIGCELPTAYPSWLVWKGKSLELDGYNEQKKVAIEFSGPLHTKWYPAKEPYEIYFERITRDVVKRRLCAKNGVLLIVIDMSLPQHHWRNYMLSRLHDAGYHFVCSELEKKTPDNYIAEQTAIPFRNPQIEKELGIDCEMARAEKL